MSSKSPTKSEVTDMTIAVYWYIKQQQNKTNELDVKIQNTLKFWNIFKKQNILNSLQLQ